MNSTMWKIALRTLARDKTYALINVAGLAIAVACCLLLGVYLRSELTYDHSHANYERIFRVVNEFEVNGKLDRFALTSPMLGPILKDENADVQAYVRFLTSGTQRFILSELHERSCLRNPVPQRPDIRQRHPEVGQNRKQNRDGRGCDPEEPADSTAAESDHPPTTIRIRAPRRGAVPGSLPFMMASEAGRRAPNAPARAASDSQVSPDRTT